MRREFSGHQCCLNQKKKNYVTREDEEGSGLLGGGSDTMRVREFVQITIQQRMVSISYLYSFRE